MIQKMSFSLAILSIVGGVFISVLFGLSEDIFKDKIQRGLEKNTKIQQIADPEVKAAKISSEANKNWRYYQRFHFHATGIGAMMMGLLIFVSMLNAPQASKNSASFLVSTGGFLYPFVWLFAALYGPEVGRAEAKDTFSFFGYMGGVFLLGGFYTFFLSLKYRLK